MAIDHSFPTVASRRSKLYFNYVCLQSIKTQKKGEKSDANHLELIYPNTVQSSKILNTIRLPLKVPLAFVQGLKPSKRNNTYFKNKY